MPLEHVLSPIEINGLEIKNRVVRTAHGTHLGEGSLSDDLIAYHEARAQGGVGLSFLEAASVHPTGPMTLHAWDDSIIPRYQELMKKVRPHGMRMFSQLNHMGYLQGPPWARPWSASEFLVPHTGMMAHAMTKAEIEEVIDAYAQGARRAVEGGLDGVEVHCAHGFLLQQFISPHYNQRTDEYGGSFENRMRFFLEVLRALRKMVGPDFPVGARVGSHNAPNGLNVEEHIDIVNRVVEEGVIDFLDVSHGVSGAASHKIIGAMHEDTGYELSHSIPIAARTTLPRLVTGRFRTLEDADTLIASGDADMVGMTRAHIADPDIVRKTLEGRPEQIRPCIGCNQGCLGGLMQGRIGCTVNVAAGNELHLGDDFLEDADTPKNILVIGGGPAGMEAARVAALRGHRVTIAEAQDTLGGTLRIAELAPKHDNIGAIADWLESEMNRLGVEILLNTTADENLIRDLKPDAAILATGATPRKDGLSRHQSETKIEGTDQDHVLSTKELFTSRHNQIGETALVFDDVGGYEAIGAAEFLVENGANVTFVTSHPAFAPLMQAPLVAAPALERLQSSGRFSLITRGVINRIGEDDVEIASLDGWPATSVPAEQVVLINAHRPNDELARRLEDLGIAVTLAGDAGDGSFLPNAFREGHRAGSAV